MKILICTLFLSFIASSQNINNRKFYLGFDAGAAFTEMAKANAPAADTFNFSGEIDIEKYTPDFAFSIGTHAGMEFLVDKMISPFLEANFTYSRLVNTDEEDGKEDNENQTLSYVFYGMSHLDITGEVGLNLNFKVGQLLMGPFISGEYGIGWRKERVRFTDTSAVRLHRRSTVNFTEFKLNFGIRFVNRLRYFSFIKGSMTSFTPSSQDNKYEGFTNFKTTTIQYDKPQYEDLKTYYSATIGGGVFF